MNLFEKIQAVSNDVRTVEKNLTVGQGKFAYKAVGELDVILAVKEAESKHRLVSIPIAQELVKSEIVDVVRSNGKTGKDYVDIVKMTLEIIDLDKPESKISITSYGRGIDTGDKGLNKASTYARKNALMNAYKIASGEDPEAEKSKDSQQTKTDDEVTVFVKNYLSENPEYSLEVTKYFNVSSFDEFTKPQILSIHKSILKKQK